MKKYIAFVRSKAFGVSGAKDFDSVADAQKHLDTAFKHLDNEDPELIKEVVSDQEELIKYLVKSDDVILRRTLGIALAEYDLPLKKAVKTIPLAPAPEGATVAIKPAPHVGSNAPIVAPKLPVTQPVADAKKKAPAKKAGQKEAVRVRQVQ